MANLRMAPEWDVSNWLNTDRPTSIASMRGRPIVAAAFQMLCPGCVAETIPQLDRVQRLFSSRQVSILGLHSVFEHHEGMGEASLKAFIHEYKIRFPIGIDRHIAGDPVPITMRTYRFRGTPTLLLIDADGRLRQQHFGHLSDLQLGAEIMALIQEASIPSSSTGGVVDGTAARCEVGRDSC